MFKSLAVKLGSPPVAFLCTLLCLLHILPYCMFFPFVFAVSRPNTCGHRSLIFLAQRFRPCYMILYHQNRARRFSIAREHQTSNRLTLPPNLLHELAPRQFFLYFTYLGLCIFIIQSLLLTSPWTSF